MEAVCKNRGIAFSYKDRFIEEQNKVLESKGLKPHSLGSTEMGRIISASNGLVDGTTLQLPTSGYHTTSETAAIAACNVYISLLQSLADKA
jgi:hypothetical protein